MDFDYNPEKDRWLRENRGIGFEEIIGAVDSGGLIADIKHPNKLKYPNQRILAVKIKNYMFAVPYVYDTKRKLKFLKTIYANRRMTKKYIKKYEI